MFHVVKAISKAVIKQEEHPRCYVIAGPNGAGKTTFALKYLPMIASCHDFINVDEIAAGLSPLDYEAGLIQAYWGDEATGARRRYYSLTQAGEQRLLEEAANWKETCRILEKLIIG